MNSFSRLSFILLVCFLAFSCKKDSANTETSGRQTITDFKAVLNGANAGTPSAATGTFIATYNSNTKTLSFTLTYKGLTPTAWHIHKSGGTIEFPLGPIVPSPLQSSVSGFTASQENDLFENKYYVNIHSAAYEGGEISGTIQKQ